MPPAGSSEALLLKTQLDFESLLNVMAIAVSFFTNQTVSVQSVPLEIMLHDSFH